MKKKKNIDDKIKERYTEKFSVGFLGRLDTPKGVHIFINSAKRLPEYEFFIAGQGVLESKFRKLAESYKNINFLGNVKDPLKFISKMDVIVVPSIREPLGNVIIESGYCKKPVIASNVDGIAEIIEKDINGILIDPDKEISSRETDEKEVPLPKVVINPVTQELQNPKEIDPLKLCESIVFLATNPNIRNSYGTNLYNKVKQKFNIENYYEKIEKIYGSF